MSEPRDELMERYADAVAHDASRPSARVRDAVLSHARLLAESRCADAAAATVVKPGTNAANQSKWTMSLVASVVLVGFTGLMVVQIDRGTPADREVALGNPRQSASIPVVATAPVVSTAPEQNVVIAVAPKRTLTPAPAPRPLPAGEATTARQEVHQDATGQVASSIENSERRVPMAPQAMADSMASVAAQKALAPPAFETDAPPAPPAQPAPLVAAARSRELGTNKAVARPTAFFEAARTGQVATIDTWLKNGVPVNTRDNNGDTALMIAVAHQQVAVVKKLLAMGADPSLINRHGQTAMELARGLQRPDLVEMLHPPR